VASAGDVLTALNRPGVADICFYAMFVLVACGLLQLTRVGAILVDRARLIDLLALACSTLLVVWASLASGEAVRRARLRRMPEPWPGTRPSHVSVRKSMRTT
jgi:hypothetical protein